jgi:hypothetical protein
MGSMGGAAREQGLSLQTTLSGHWTGVLIIATIFSCLWDSLLT